MEDNTNQSDNDLRLQVGVVLGSAALGLGIALPLIYYFKDYGLACFLVLPTVIGFLPGYFYSLFRRPTSRLIYWLGYFTLGTAMLSFFIIGLEGLICIFIAGPLLLPGTAFGSYLLTVYLKRWPSRSMKVVLLALACAPATAFVEKALPLIIEPVTTAIEINAPPAAVWRHINHTPQLPPADELAFRAGIAYPVKISTQGQGVGATRYCQFSTGTFVEPITAWEEGRLLEFEVAQQPAPMTELSYLEIDPPHLHNYFVARRGRFKLTPLPGGRTLLEGTSWYSYDIRPFGYWRIWSQYLIHLVHNRVLQQIKANAEEAAKVGGQTQQP